MTTAVLNSASPKTRITQLDGVRALAILLVFSAHALNVKLTWMGVDIFFVLSGFLITGVLLDSKQFSFRATIAQFYAKRVRRILVPYLLFLMVASLVVGLSWAHYWYFYILLANFLRPLDIPRPYMFAPLWSLAVEEQFYLVWPFAVYFLNHKHLQRLCVALIILAPILRGVVHFPTHWAVYMLTPFRMDTLAAGGLLCLVWRNRKEWILRNGPLLGGILSAVGLVGLIVLQKLGYNTYGNTRIGNVLIYEFCLLLAFGINLFALGGVGVGIFQWSWVRYLGRISYTMYLVQFGVILLLEQYMQGMRMAAVALGVIIVYATISWYLIELPLLSPRRSWVWRVRQALSSTT